MLSNKQIICPENLLKVAKSKKDVTAGIVNAGKPLPMHSAMEAVKENLITPIFIGEKDEIQKSHVKPTPRIGGIAVLMGCLLAWYTSDNMASKFLGVIIFSSLPVIFEMSSTLNNAAIFLVVVVLICLSNH